MVAVAARRLQADYAGATLLALGTIPWGTPSCAGRVQTGGLADLCRRLQFTDEPANISGFHRIRRYDDFFDMIAFGAIEGAKFESGRPRRDARKCHARSAFRAV
jgi:hypothetical protein